MIDKNFNEIIYTIENSSIYQNYQHVLKQVEANDEIKNLVENIKVIQKKIVHAKAKNNDVVKFEKELSNINKRLNSIPLYQSYIDISNEVNDLMKLINNRIQNYINKLNI